MKLPSDLTRGNEESELVTPKTSTANGVRLDNDESRSGA